MPQPIKLLILNSESWFNQRTQITTDRMTLLVLLGCIDLALRHPQYPATSGPIAKSIGTQIITHLLEAGFIVDDQVRRSWEETFDISP